MPADNYKLAKEISMEWIIEPLATPPVDGGIQDVHAEDVFAM